MKFYSNQSDQNHYKKADIQPLVAGSSLYLIMFILFYMTHSSLCEENNNNNNHQKITRTILDVANAPIRCSAGQETLKLVLELERDQTENILFLKNQQKITLNLIYDKITPHFDVSKTNKTDFGIFRTDILSEQTFFKRESLYPQQFRSISEFYGTIDELEREREGEVFIRALVNFVDCNHVLLFGFIRVQNILYQIQPLKSNLKLPESAITTQVQNIHVLEEILTDLGDFELFSVKSKAIDNHLDYNRKLAELREESENFVEEKDKIENKFCVVNIIVDTDFFKLHNQNLHQVIMYAQIALILANEIFKNSEWKHDYHSLYGFTLGSIHVNHSFGLGRTEHLKPDLLTELSLVEPDIHSDSCLTHLFTSKPIKDNQSLSLNGISKIGGIFKSNNISKLERVGATSLNSCKEDPWNINCLRGFSHELAHSLGSLDDEDDKNEQENNKDEQENSNSDKNPTKNSFLMTQKKFVTPKLTENNFKLSNKSLDEISANLKTFSSRLKEIFISATSVSNCGNGILEQGEECDEGTSELCCFKCKLKSFAICSPYNSLCCDEKCNFKSSGPCMPWNYCNDREHFCQNQDVYCRPEKIHVKCDSAVAKSNRNLLNSGGRKIQKSQENYSFTKKSFKGFSTLSPMVLMQSEPIKSGAEDETVQVNQHSNYSFWISAVYFILIMLFVSGIIIVSLIYFKRYNAAPAITASDYRIISLQESRFEPNNQMEIQLETIERPSVY